MVGDVALWAPEGVLSVLALGVAALAAAGWVSERSVSLAWVGCAVLVAGQLSGVRLLDGLLPRRPSWAVIADTAPLNAETRAVVAIPTDLPIRGLTAARVGLLLLLLLLPLLPTAFALALLAPCALLFWPAHVPQVSAQFRLAEPVGKELGVPIVLAGASRRDAQGLLGTLDWLHAERPAILWVVGVGGGVEHVAGVRPWTWSGPARRRLLDPAILKLWLRGFDVWVVGGGDGALGTAIRLALAQAMKPA